MCIQVFVFLSTVYIDISLTHTHTQSWLQIVAAKQLYFHAVAQHRLGKVAQADKSFGVAVARMSKAVALMQEADKRGEGAFKGYVSIAHRNVQDI